MKLRLLIVVFLIAATKMSLHAQPPNYIPNGVPAPSLISNNYVYGYYFQATTNFTICGLKVKYDNNVSPTNQRLFVVKFTVAPLNYTGPTPSYFTALAALIAASPIRSRSSSVIKGEGVSSTNF